MGLRRSEALGLRWSRIDWEQNTVLLDTKVVEYERDGEKVVEPVEEMKNKSSRRTLPLPGPVREMLETEKEKQEIYRKMFGKSYDLRYMDFVCVDQLGRLILLSRHETIGILVFSPPAGRGEHRKKISCLFLLE